jgi:EmrB/QacA subfamily drug resistance transporter
MEKSKGIQYKWLALMTTSIGAVVSTLDFSIVNISLPRLTKVFSTEPSVTLWVTVAYLLTSVSLMFIFGKIGDIFGRKRVYILGFSLFTLGLILCSVAQSIVQLILFRVIQAVGTGMIVSLGNAIVTDAFPGEERGKALGIYGAMTSTGLLSGPVLGGFLLDLLDWRSIFYVRIPIGVLGIIMSIIFLKKDMRNVKKPKFDWIGSASLSGGLACLLLFFNLGGKYGFNAVPVLALAASTLVLIFFFIMFERKTDHPILDLNLFRNRRFAMGNLSAVIMFIATSAYTFLMPFFLIEGLSYSSGKSGLLFAINSMMSLVVAPFSGALSDKVGSRNLCTVGLVLVCAGLFSLSRLGADAGLADIIPRLGVMGFGMGMFSSPNNSSIMGSVPRDKLGTGSAMIASMRQIGISSGTAIAGAIYTSRQVFHITEFANQNLTQAISNQLTIIYSIQDAFVIATIICGLGIIAAFAAGKFSLKG